MPTCDRGTPPPSKTCQGPPAFPCCTTLPPQGCRCSECDKCVAMGGKWCGQLNGYSQCVPANLTSCDGWTEPPTSRCCCGGSIYGNCACESCSGCVNAFGRYCDRYQGMRGCLPMYNKDSCEQGTPAPAMQCDAPCCNGRPSASCRCSSCQGCVTAQDGAGYCGAGTNGTSLCVDANVPRCPNTSDSPRFECGCSQPIKQQCSSAMSRCLSSCRSSGMRACQTCMQGKFNRCCACFRELGVSLSCN